MHRKTFGDFDAEVLSPRQRRCTAANRHQVPNCNWYVRVTIQSWQHFKHGQQSVEAIGETAFLKNSRCPHPSKIHSLCRQTVLDRSRVRQKRLQSPLALRMPRQHCETNAHGFLRNESSSREMEKWNLSGKTWTSVPSFGKTA